MISHKIQINCADPQAYKEDLLALVASLRPLLQPTHTWANSLTQFHEFRHPSSSPVSLFFFKLWTTYSSNHYSQDAHFRLHTSLQKLYLPLRVAGVDRGFETSTYLLQSDKNYISLAQYITIKRQTGQCIDQKFILDFISFSRKLIQVLIQAQAYTNITPHNIVFNRPGEFRLADYDLLFYPLNKRVQSTIGMQEKYSNQVTKTLFWLITLQQPQGQSVISQRDLETIWKILEKREPQNLSYGFRRIVTQIFEKEKWDWPFISAELRMLTQKSGTSKESLVTNSLVSELSKQDEKDYNTKSTAPGSEASSLDEPLLLVNNSPQDGPLTKTRKKLRALLRRRIHSRSVRVTLVLIFLILSIPSLLYLDYSYVNSSEICYPNQYVTKGGVCRNCPNGCTRCIGENETECTKCREKMWLVVDNELENQGHCEWDCLGRQYSDGKCVIGPPREVNSDSLEVESYKTLTIQDDKI